MAQRAPLFMVQRAQSTVFEIKWLLELFLPKQMWNSHANSSLTLKGFCKLKRVFNATFQYELE